MKCELLCQWMDSGPWGEGSHLLATPPRPAAGCRLAKGTKWSWQWGGGGTPRERGWAGGFFEATESFALGMCWPQPEAKKQISGLLPSSPRILAHLPQLGDTPHPSMEVLEGDVGPPLEREHGWVAVPPPQALRESSWEDTAWALPPWSPRPPCE